MKENFLKNYSAYLKYLADLSIKDYLHVAKDREVFEAYHVCGQGIGVYKDKMNINNIIYIIFTFLNPFIIVTCNVVDEDYYVNHYQRKLNKKMYVKTIMRKAYKFLCLSDYRVKFVEEIKHFLPRYYYETPREVFIK